MTKGTPALFAICATAGTSITSRPGLPITSPNTIFVFGWIAFSIASKSLGATNVVVMPYLGNVCSNRLMLAPYICDDATIWSPWLASERTVKNSAAIPDDTATQATPPSRAATRCSRVAIVGLVRRE